MTIVNVDSGVINKLETLLSKDARVVIYDRHMFIVHGTRYRTLSTEDARELKYFI